MFIHHINFVLAKLNPNSACGSHEWIEAASSLSVMVDYDFFFIHVGLLQVEVKAK